MNPGEEFFNLLDDLKCEMIGLREELEKLRQALENRHPVQSGEESISR